MSGSISLPVTVSTVGLGTFSLKSFPLEDNAVYLFELRVSVRRTSGGTDQGSFRSSACLYRAGAGALQQGLTAVEFSEASQATYAIAIAPSGNDCLCAVTTGVVHNLTWSGSLTYTRVG